MEEEVVNFLKNRCYFLYRELRMRKKTLGKIIRYIQKHRDEPHLMLSRAVVKIMRFRQNQLKKRIKNLQIKIRKYREAIVGLKQNNPDPAIKLLEEILFETPAVPMITSSEVMIPSPNPLGERIGEMINKLWSRLNPNP